jgi:hypothetical protein
MLLPLFKKGFFFPVMLQEIIFIFIFISLLASALSQDAPSVGGASGQSIVPTFNGTHCPKVDLTFLEKDIFPGTGRERSISIFLPATKLDPSSSAYTIVGGMASVTIYLNCPSDWTGLPAPWTCSNSTIDYGLPGGWQPPFAFQAHEELLEYLSGPFCKPRSKNLNWTCSENVVCSSRYQLVTNHSLYECKILCEAIAGCMAYGFSYTNGECRLPNPNQPCVPGVARTASTQSQSQYCRIISCQQTQVAHSNREASGAMNGTNNQHVQVTCNQGYTGGGIATCNTNDVEVTQLTGNIITVAVVHSHSLTQNQGVNVTQKNGFMGTLNVALNGSATTEISIKSTAGGTDFDATLNVLIGTVTLTADMIIHTSTFIEHAIGPGQGSFNTVTCNAQPCSPTQVLHSNKAAAGSIVGTTGQSVTITCDQGFLGGGNSTCNSFGTFSHIDCKPPKYDITSSVVLNLTHMEMVLRVTPAFEKHVTCDIMTNTFLQEFYGFKIIHSDNTTQVIRDMSVNDLNIVSCNNTHIKISLNEKMVQQLSLLPSLLAESHSSLTYSDSKYQRRASLSNAVYYLVLGESSYTLQQSIVMTLLPDIRPKQLLVSTTLHLTNNSIVAVFHPSIDCNHAFEMSVLLEKNVTLSDMRSGEKRRSLSFGGNSAGNHFLFNTTLPKDSNIMITHCSSSSRNSGSSATTIIPSSSTSSHVVYDLSQDTRYITVNMSSSPIIHLCKTDGTWYYPLNGITGQERTVGTPEECQKRCRDTTGCVYFNSFPNGGCHLTTGQDGSAVPTTNPTAKSGSKHCAFVAQKNVKKSYTVAEFVLNGNNIVSCPNIVNNTNWKVSGASSGASNSFAVTVGSDNNGNIITVTSSTGWEFHLVFECKILRKVPMDILFGTISEGFSSLDMHRIAPSTSTNVNIYIQLMSTKRLTEEEGILKRNQVIVSPTLTYTNKLNYIEDHRIFHTIRHANIDIGLGGLLELNFTENLNCSSNHYNNPTFIHFIVTNLTSTFEAHIQHDSNTTGATMVSCIEETIVFRLSNVLLNELQLGDPPLPNPFPTYSVYISPSYSTVAQSNDLIIVPRRQHYTKSMPILFDDSAPCVAKISMEENSDILVITFDEKIVPTTGTSLGSSGDLVYGTHFKVEIESGSTNMVSVGNNAKVLDILKVQGTKQQYAMRVKLDHGIRPSGNEVVTVIVWPSPSTKNAPANAGVQDLSNNQFCKASEWPSSVSQIPVTLSRIPGIVVAPLTITIGEASQGGVEGYGAYITVRLDTPPKDADVKVTLTSSAANQIIFSNNSILFKYGSQTWSDGIQVQINAVQDNTPETVKIGDSHSTAIIFAIDTSNDRRDSIYNEHLVSAYGADAIPKVEVIIYDPVPNSIPPPQITSIRFHSSLTYLSIFFDEKTDASNGAVVPCENILILPAKGTSGANILGAIEERVCTWITAKEFRIYLGYGATVRANTKISLKDQTVYGKCEIYNSLTKKCDNFRLACEGCFAPVQWPVPAAGTSVFRLNPTIVPSYSNTLGLCDDLFVDFSASKGSGPFPWELLSFATLSCTGLTGITDNCQGIQSNPMNANATIDQKELSVTVPRSNFPSGTGKIIFQASLRNIIGETSTTTVAIDLVADAKPTFILAGSRNRRILRTQESVVSVKTVKLPCGGIKGALKVTWSSLLGLKNNDPSTLHRLDLTPKNPSKIVVQGTTLKSGYRYNITGKANLDGYAGVETSSSVYFDVLHSPLVAVVTPPGTRTVGVEDSVLLDGSASHDPDQDGTLGYVWSCSNCPSTVNTILAAGTAGGGSVTGAPKITIPHGSFSQGTTYQFQLFVFIVGSSSRASSTVVSSGVEVQAGDPPDVSVKSPRIQYPNANEPMVIEAEVYSCCKLADFQCSEYAALWSGTGLLEGESTSSLADVLLSKPNLFLNDPNKVVDQNKNTGFRMYKIIVAPNQLTPGSDYSFTLAVTDSCGSSQSILPTIRMNSPPSGGSITVSGIENEGAPPSGWSLTSASATMFSLNARGWSDPEAMAGIDSVLTYTFVYLTDPADLTSKKIKLFNGVDISSYSTNLPVGSGSNGLMKIAVLVEDEDGGKAISSWVSVYVTAEPLPQSIQQQEAVFDRLISNNVESAQNTSDSQEVIAAASMISSVLTSDAVNKEVKEKVARTLVDMAFRASETMAVDADSVDMQAQFVGTIATSTTLDEETANKVLSMTENLAETSENNGAMSTDTQTALTSTLTAFILSNNAASSSAISTSTTNTGTIAGGTVSGTGTALTSTVTVVNVEKVQRLQAAVTSVMSAVATGLIPGAKPVAIATEAFTATVESARPSALVEKLLKSVTGLSIQISAGTFGSVTSGSDVESLVVEFKDQPSLDNGTTNMGADGVRVVFKTGGKALKVNNLVEPNVLKLPLKADATQWAKNKTSDAETIKLASPSRSNRTIVSINCEYVGQNHTITNCSSSLPSFNYSCLKKDDLLEMVCPKISLLPECVYWNKTMKSWEKNGLITIVDNITGEVTCSSDHLTDFSVKVVSSFDVVDDILASPLKERVADPEELMAVLYRNVVVIVTMLITFGVFLFAFFASRYYDANYVFMVKKKGSKIHQIKNVWSASRGIISWKQLEQNIHATSWWCLWAEGIKAYHPLLSIYFTHSMAITRPQRVMILMVMITTNMFVDAMFWRVRYPDDAESKPEFTDTIMFGMIAAALNVPVIKLFEELYKRVGAAVVSREKILLLGRSIIKGNAATAADRLSTHVRTVEDAKLHLQVVQGAVIHTNELLENQKTRHVLMKEGSSMQKMSMLDLEEYSTRHEDMIKQYERAKRILAEKLQQAEEADRRMLQLKKMEHEYELFGAASSCTVEQVNQVGQLKTDQIGNGTSVTFIKHFSPASPQEKKNKIPTNKSSSKYALAVEQKPSHQKRTKGTARKATRCCPALRLKYRMYQESNTLLEKKRMSNMTDDEALIEEKLKKKNFIVNQLYIKNKEDRDPGFDFSPAPWWAHTLLDFFSMTMVLFFCYFIVAFGFYYGQDVAISWLQAFVLSILTDFIVITPIAIFVRVVIIPRFVAYTVFQGDPDIQHISSTPLMSGAIGSLGPVGQAAYALGLASVAAVGATGFAAKKWLTKTRERERRARLTAKVRYIKQETDDPSNPYGVTAILEDDAYRRERSRTQKKTRYATSSIIPRNGINQLELQSAVSDRVTRARQKNQQSREHIKVQDQDAVEKVDKLSEEIMMNFIVEILLQHFVEPNVQKSVLNDVDQKQLERRHTSLEGIRSIMSEKEYTLIHDVANALPHSNNGILNMILEMLVEESLSVLAGGKHIPGHQRHDLFLKSKTGELAEFYLQMGLNRRRDDIMEKNKEKNEERQQLKREKEREQREQKRMKFVGDKNAQKKLFEKTYTGDFGSGAHEKYPSVILDRARKKLFLEVVSEDQSEKIAVSADLIDPAKSPFAKGMTADEVEALRKQLPGIPPTSRRRRRSFHKNRHSGEADDDPLALEIKTRQNANRDARIAALSMLNE